MKKIYTKLSITGLILSILVIASSCSLDSKQTIYVDNIKDPIKTVEQLKAASVGTYSLMVGSTYYGRDMIIFSEARSPYMYSTGASGRFNTVSGFNILPTHSYSSDTWERIYKVILNANLILEAEVDKDNTEVMYYLGQAYIIRALAHYDLLRLYGQQYLEGQTGLALGIPYIVTFADVDADVKRESVDQNRTNIYADLDLGIKTMKQAVDKGFKEPTNRIRINLATAYGLKSRITLFFSTFFKQDLEKVITSVESSLLYATNSNVVSRSSFLDSYKSEEAQPNSLFELAQLGNDNLGTNSLFHIYNTNPGYGDLVWNGASKTTFFPEKENDLIVQDIRSEIVQKDARGTFRNIGKYVSRTSNVKLMRYEELLLIYAEATALGATNSDQTKALTYLNSIVSNRVLLIDPKIVNHAGIPKKYESLTLENVRKERTLELMFEGFGFEDAIRAHKPISNPQSKNNPKLTNGAANFGDALLAFPIPQSEINVSKIPQNKDY